MALIFPLGADPEELLKKALHDYLEAGDIYTAIDGEKITPRHIAVIKSAEEQRVGIPHIHEDGRTLWQNWEVVIDIVGDDRGAGHRTSHSSPVASSNSAKLNLLFLQERCSNRNAYGIYTATLRKRTDLRDGVEFKNPFAVTCDTFTFIPELIDNSTP